MRLFPALFALICGSLASPAQALPVLPEPASCSACDHTIAPGTGEVNGTTLGIAPGATVCLQAGDYAFIRFREIRGAEGAPITILNCGGVVDVHNTDRGYGVDFQGSSQFFRFTGSGTAGIEYGIRVSASRRGPDYPGMGLWFLDKSTNYEADHIEVHDTGFAGVMAKTDPLCDGSADQGTFVQRNVHLHHLWVHDTGGEGFYVGSTQSAGQTIQCNGSAVKRQPHFLEGIELDHNLVENTEWDGMQVGMAHQGCRVHHNVIRHVGTAGEMYQQQGLQIGTFSACDVRANDLRDGPAMGIFVLGAGDTTVGDNLVANFGEDTVYMNVSGQAPARYAVHFNTLLGYKGSALRVFGKGITSAVSNNFVVGPSTALGVSNEVTSESLTNNVFVADLGAAAFVGADDFHLSEASPARHAGIGLSAQGFVRDLDGLLRSSPPAVGAYEFVGDADPASWPDASTPAPSDDGGATGGESDAGVTPRLKDADGGCSLSAPSRARGGLVWLALMLGVACVRRGQRRGARAAASSLNRAT
ncbi:MAG: hypothetical protein QM778_14925 [Myxococcales bacterium]